MPKKESKICGMVLDEARYDILNGMNNIVYMHGRQDFINAIDRLGHKNAFIEFCRELSEKGHAMGWCKDPGCTHTKAS